MQTSLNRSMSKLTMSPNHHFWLTFPEMQNFVLEIPASSPKIGSKDPTFQWVCTWVRHTHLNFLSTTSPRSHCITVQIIVIILSTLLRNYLLLDCEVEGQAYVDDVTPVINRLSTQCIHHTHGAGALLCCVWCHQHTLALPLGNLKVKIYWMHILTNNF